MTQNIFIIIHLLFKYSLYCNKYKSTQVCNQTTMLDIKFMAFVLIVAVCFHWFSMPPDQTYALFYHQNDESGLFKEFRKVQEEFLSFKNSRDAQERKVQDELLSLKKSLDRLNRDHYKLKEDFLFEMS